MICSRVAVETRAMQRNARRNREPLIVPDFGDLSYTPEQISNLQKEDETLKKSFDKVARGTYQKDENIKVTFHIKNNLLYRKEV